MTINPTEIPLGDFSMQAHILREQLPDDPGDSLRRRSQMTLTIAAGFERLVARLAPNLILEIGAHDGSFSRKMKSALPRSNVVAIEANPVVYLKHQAALTQAGVLYMRKCISRSSGTVNFQVPLKKGKAANSMGSIFLDSRNKNFHTYSVEAIPLDSLIGSESSGTNAIWLDVEGAMGEVVDGGFETFSRCLALYCEMESEPRWAGQALDYQLHGRLKSLGLTPIIRDIQRDWQYNAVFIRDSLASSKEVMDILAETLSRAVSGA